jgi:hypothetical protein
MIASIAEARSLDGSDIAKERRTSHAPRSRQSGSGILCVPEANRVARPEAAERASRSTSASSDFRFLCEIFDFFAHPFFRVRNEETWRSLGGLLR